jgi:bifunctional UDP-N-acetylglucosamine pyrophosphorylase/glucosamine-1-phosphate N-acetyltransferase
MGINTRQDLAIAHEVLRKKTVRKLQEKGVTIMDADSTYIWPSVRIGRDSVIYPNVHIQGNTVIGKRCTIYPNVRIIDSRIKEGAIIKDSTLIENSSVGAGAQVGPFSHIRPESSIGESAKIGNFVEVKKSSIGRGAKAMHLSYLGDATIGKEANIGAGTITCNYDGKKKHKTVIEDGVFVGSDTQLVAPVRVGKGSYIGAGSTITKDVPAGDLAVSRADQKNLKGWAKKKRTSVSKKRSSRKNLKSKR